MIRKVPNLFSPGKAKALTSSPTKFEMNAKFGCVGYRFERIFLDMVDLMG